MAHHLRSVGLTLFLLALNACTLPDIQMQDIIVPIRVFFNHERSYWSNTSDLKGDAGSIERVYYKNGRPALERYYDKSGLLESVYYLGRSGEAIRYDSLVYSNDVLIAGYYFAEPEHSLILRFLNYKKQGQLSQRSWFGGRGELLGREFFLFNRKGDRQTRMIFDGKDSLVYSEKYGPGNNQLDLKNTYTSEGGIASQTRYSTGKPPVRYDFDKHTSITMISQLTNDEQVLWSNALIYGKSGLLERSNFYTNDQFLFSHLGNIEFNWQTTETWKHPAQPGETGFSYRIGHQNPFIVEISTPDQDLQLIEYRLPETGAVFKRSLKNHLGNTLVDTLFSNRGRLQPIQVTLYDSMGLVESEFSYDDQGGERWRHTWTRDDQDRVIREELFASPDSFISAITRVYDPFGSVALSEYFTSPDSFAGSWVSYHGGGINRSLHYNDDSELTETWLFRPAGDTVQHSTYSSVGYIRIESKLGTLDTLLSQRRFTEDGILDWELFFNGDGQLTQETHRKKDGSIYREVSYDHVERLIKSNTFAPIEISEIIPGSEIKGELSTQVLTRLNSLGEVVQVVSKNSSGVVSWEKRYAYRGGRLLKSAQLGPDGKPLVISSYTYNKQGQVLEETALDPKGNLVHTVENRYNNKHQLIWKLFESVLAGTESSNRYYYDTEGRIKRDEIIESTRFLEAIEYEYFPEYYIRIATHLTPDGELIRKEIENYYGENVFTLNAHATKKEK